MYLCAQTHTSLFSLHTTNKVLCGRHFALSQFYDNKRQKLSKFAVPDSAEVEEVLNKRQNIFMQENLIIMPRCINCWIAIPITQQYRYKATHMDLEIISVLEDWIARQVIDEDHLCQECVSLLILESNNRNEGNIGQRQFGHDSVCVCCGISIARRTGRQSRQLNYGDAEWIYSTNIISPLQEIETITEALPTSKTFLLKPIEDLQLQDTPAKTQELPSCSSTTVDNTDICDDDDNAADDLDTLVESNVCRVCLAMDVKIYDLNNIELREMFQNITGIAVTENNQPLLEGLCWECAGRLKAAAAFRNKALLSDGLLQGLANTGEQIRKNDITLIKDSEDYLKTAATLTVVEAFHTVDIDPENDGIPPLSENNDTKIVQNTLRNDFLKQKNESIIEEHNNQREVEDESMIEVPINTEMEYDQFDHIYPNTGEESSNVFLETNPIFSSNIHLEEDTINSMNSSPPPFCSHVKLKYPVLGYLLKTPSDCEDKVKKHVIKITKRNSISKIVSKNSKELISAKSKNNNVKISGISKKTSNLKLLKSTLVQANRTDEESLENFEF